MALFIKLIMTSLILVFAQGNVELTAKHVRDNKNYIYMESKTVKYKLVKKELTPEGIAQILKNKDKELTLFVPPKSIKKKTDKNTH